jgi:hypothetical protein
MMATCISKGYCDVQNICTSLGHACSWFIKNQSILNRQLKTYSKLLSTEVKEINEGFL